jgi:Na+-transporting NADH:ubiquinone oxidoreductase subunit NqrD
MANDIDPHVIIALFHIFLVAPLFFFVGYMRANTPEWLYWILLILGLVVLVYHAYKGYIKYIFKSSSVWVNLIHVLFVAPLLIYIGYRQKETLRFAYELMFMGGFAVLGYHTLSLIRSIETMDRMSKV